jgi:CRP/FNR family transcriptional regulator
MKQLTMETKDFNALNKSLPPEFFSSLTMPEIERLVQTIELCSFEPGEYVFHRGTAGDALYIVYEGTIAVCHKNLFFLPEKVLVTLGPGQIVGEMALLDHKAHHSSVRAVTAVKMFVILTSAFDFLCQSNPIFQKELSIIAERRRFQNRHHS